MEDRDFDYTMMNIERYGGGMSSLLMTSAAMSMKLMVFLLRMAKKGLMSLRYSDHYSRFVEETGGNFTVYNIPLTKEHAERLKDNMEKLADLESSLSETKNPRKKAELHRQIETVQSDMPEFEQLKKLGIHFCALPKVNGLDYTVQVAVANKDSELFKNWFLNHICAGLSGGAKDFHEIKAMTEGNSSIFNVPVEGERLQDMLHDLDILEVNYSVLPDLKVGDGSTQIAVANTDIHTLKAWFSMYQQRQLAEGSEIPNMYPISEGAYLNTSTISAQEYIDHSDAIYQQANNEYEKQSHKVAVKDVVRDENSHEYVQLSADENYTKITIDKETLINHASEKSLSTIDEMGYFGARIPGYYGKTEKEIMLPKDKVFTFRDGQTYAGFVPKFGTTKVYDVNSGHIEEWEHGKIMSRFDKINRNLAHVKNLMSSPSPSVIPEKTTPSIPVAEPLEQAILPEKTASKRPVIGEHSPQPGKNRFKNFTERQYDMQALEKLLMQKHLSGSAQTASGTINAGKTTLIPKVRSPK